MPLARLVVTAVRTEDRSKSAVAREYRVSRRRVHELVRRFDTEGEAGLVPRSRRPHTCPARTAAEVQEAIVGWRKRLCEQGLDAGAATIAVHLATEYETVPSTATIWRVLSRRGMVVPQPHKRPRSSYTRSGCRYAFHDCGPACIRFDPDCAAPDRPGQRTNS